MDMKQRLELFKARAEDPVLQDFIGMLLLQDAANEYAVPGYLPNKFMWHYAVGDEANEIVNHCGWKHWKDVKSPYTQLMFKKLDWDADSKTVSAIAMEFIDIDHFVKAQLLQLINDVSDNTAENLIRRAFKAVHDPMQVRGSATHACTNKLRTLAYAIQGLCSDIDTMRPEISWPTPDQTEHATLAVVTERLFTLLARGLVECGRNWDQYVKVYVTKNVLNLFRWKDGRYKDGSYIKIWFDGREDTEHATDLAEAYFAEEHKEDSLENYLNAGLTKLYAQTVKQAAEQPA